MIYQVIGYYVLHKIKYHKFLRVKNRITQSAIFKK